MVRVYTRKGDDGTTGLLFGGRVGKDHVRIELLGAVDEAQAALGLARATTVRTGELDVMLVELERELYVLMAEVATSPANRRKLEPRQSLVDEEMVRELEDRIDSVSERFTMPAEFVVPGGNPTSAALDFARTVVRRAERVLATAPPLSGAGEVPEIPSSVGPFLNRLSDLLWTMARWQEGDEHVVSRVPPGNPR